MSMGTKCDKCEADENKKKYLKKINGSFLCKSCYIKNRKNRREDTIEEFGIKEELKELDKKLEKEWNRKSYKKRRKIKKIIPRDKEPVSPPKPKGIKIKTERYLSNCFLSLEERQSLFRILKRRGMGDEEAKERIKGLVDYQKKTRKEMKEKGKSEEEIKIKSQRLLEELWNY